MKAKFVLLIAAGLFLVTASQAQFPGSYKDNRDANSNGYAMNYNRNQVYRDYREIRNDQREFRNDRHELSRHRRHHHHGHRQGRRSH